MVIANRIVFSCWRALTLKINMWWALIFHVHSYWFDRHLISPIALETQCGLTTRSWSTTPVVRWFCCLSFCLFFFISLKLSLLTSQLFCNIPRLKFANRPVLQLLKVTPNTVLFFTLSVSKTFTFYRQFILKCHGGGGQFLTVGVT